MIRLITTGLAAAFFVFISTSAFAVDKSLIHNAAFSEDWSRYPSPDTILSVLRENFPSVKLRAIGAECYSLTDANRPLLGDSEPATGRPSIDEPNSSFVNWYANCLASYVKSEATYSLSVLTTPTLEDFREFYGDQIITECLAKDDPGNSFARNPQFSYFSCRWGKISDEAKSVYLHSLILRYIGPEDVLIDLGIAKTEAELAGRIMDEVNQFAAKPDHRFDFLGTENGELTVTRANMILKFLLNLEETLKY